VAFRLTTSRARPPKTLLPPVLESARARSRMTLTLTIWAAAPRPASPGRRWAGAPADPNNPKKPPPPLLADGRAHIGAGDDAGRDRHRAGSREQLIDAHVDHIDAVFLTHEHADQTHGIDDLRSVVLHQRRRIPVYLNLSTSKDIMHRFSLLLQSRRRAATIRRS